VCARRETTTKQRGKSVDSSEKSASRKVRNAARRRQMPADTKNARRSGEKKESKVLRGMKRTREKKRVCRVVAPTTKEGRALHAHV